MKKLYLITFSYDADHGSGPNGGYNHFEDKREILSLDLSIFINNFYYLNLHVEKLLGNDWPYDINSLEITSITPL